VLLFPGFATAQARHRSIVVGERVDICIAKDWVPVDAWNLNALIVGERTPSDGRGKKDGPFRATSMNGLHRREQCFKALCQSPCLSNE
jgi:hypothetical protein